MFFHCVVYGLSFVFFVIVYGFGVVSNACSIASPLCSLLVFVVFFIVLFTFLLLPLKFFLFFLCGAGSVSMGLPKGLASLSMWLSMLLTWSFFYCPLCLSVAAPVVFSYFPLF